ncbi:hypothetical protein HDV05_001853, partial [Chytridiales sp. JEL 0842]
MPSPPQSILVATLLFLSTIGSQQVSAQSQCGPILPATQVPSKFNLNTNFYKKYLPGPGGLPIVGSDKVRDEALYRAQALLFNLASTMNPQIFTFMSGTPNIRAALMAESELTTDIPEHSDLTPKEYWDQRARGLGATLARPAVSGGEENLLCTPSDRYRGECILLHELSHSIQEFGANYLFPDFQSRLDAAFANVVQRNLFENTYARTNPAEYWAEGAQAYFDCNAVSSPPNGVHGEIG